MKSNHWSSMCALAACLILSAQSQPGLAASTATDLVTICKSATGTTQASKCTSWEYNVYSPSAYIESYPQVSPGPKTWTDPLYEYRLGSSIASSMGVKVCPTALVPGTSYNTPQSDPCPNNLLVSASSVIAGAPSFAPAPGTTPYGPRMITNLGLFGQTAVTLTDTSPNASIYYTTDGAMPSRSATLYNGPILLPVGEMTNIQAVAYPPNANAPSTVVSGSYTVPFFPSDSFPDQLPTDLLTICTSATATTQAAQCTRWQYNFFSPVAYLESYPQVSPGSKGFYDPSYAYRLGSSITSSMGVKVCPSALLPGTSYAAASADPCPNNVLVSAASAIPSATNGSSTFLIQNESNQNPVPQGSCQYYQDIGAIPSSISNPCALNPDGSFVHGLTKGQWMTTFYTTLATAAGSTQGSALFVNINDLNFVRQHTAVMNAAQTQTAAIVCNFPGPDFYQSAITPSGVVDQAAVDAAIQNAQNGLHPLPCVAFDYGFYNDPNSVPYMRFLVFNPAGNLAAAVDLDGRGPKQIPNACSACHGVPDDPNGNAYQLGTDFQSLAAASFIPFDEGNFVFSSVVGLRRVDQEAQIKLLNLIVLGAGIGNSKQSADLSTLIHGWYDTYADGGLRVVSPLTFPTQQSWAPPALVEATLLPSQNPLGTATPATQAAAKIELQAYTDIYAPYCRSCHVANQVQQLALPNQPGDLVSFFTADVRLCNPSSNLTMPNSKIAFDRFWTTHTVPNSAQPDLPSLAKSFLGASCTFYPFPPAVN